jgi:hypothetical protein
LVPTASHSWSASFCSAVSGCTISIPLGKLIAAVRKFEQCLLGVGVGVFSGVPTSVLGELLPVLLGRRQSIGIGGRGVLPQFDQPIEHFLQMDYIGDHAPQMPIVILPNSH